MKMICSCGMNISKAQRRHHGSSVWHREHRRIRALRKAGMSFHAIGKQMGTSQTYIHQCFRRAA